MEILTRVKLIVFISLVSHYHIYLMNLGEHGIVFAIQRNNEYKLIEYSTSKL